MPQRYSIAEARNRFTAIVRQAERESPVELTRRGKPVAVILSIQEYRRLSGASGGFWQAFTKFKNKVNLAALEIEPATFGRLRDRSLGREVAL
jgi:antitoxin Phd